MPSELALIAHSVARLIAERQREFPFLPVDGVEQIIAEKIAPLMAANERLVTALDDNWVTHQRVVKAESESASLRQQVETLKQLWLPCDQTVQCALCLWVDWEYEGNGPHGDDCPLGYITNQLRKTQQENERLNEQASINRSFELADDNAALRQENERLKSDNASIVAESRELKKNLRLLVEYAKDNAALRQQVAELRTAIKKIVETDGQDAGVIYLSSESPTHFDHALGCHVYENEHFSPLGDALVGLWKLAAIDAAMKEPNRDT